MSVRVLMYIYRKEGISPDAFKEYYETKHVQIIQSISGRHFPAVHSRHYIGFVPQAASPKDPVTSADSLHAGGAVNQVKAAEKLLAGQTDLAGQHVPMVVQGEASFFDWDACTIMTFTNEAHLRGFMVTMKDPANAKILADDEEHFMDRSKFKAVILGENRTTANNDWSDEGPTASPA